MSMSVFLRGVKKLQVNTAFGGSLTAADVGTSLADFLALCDRGKKEKEAGENCMMMSFQNLYSSPYILLW